MMKKQMKRFVSAFIICCMLMMSFGILSFATEGTADATLASLEISPGTLAPAFSPDVYEYSVEVGADCDKLLVNAKTTDSGAKMVIAGNSGLQVGMNSVIINVTAADGVTTAKYTIQVTRGASETAAEAPSGGASEAPVPGGTDAAPAAGAVTTAGKTLTLAEPNETAIPEGFRETTIPVGNQSVKAWSFPGNMDVEGYYLLYGTDEAGKTAFYLYDAAEGTAITAPEGVLAAGQDSLISQNQLKTSQDSYQKALRQRMMIIIALSVLCFVLLIAFTAAMTRKKHVYEEEIDDRGDEPEDDGYYEDEPEDDGYYEDEPEDDGYYEDEPEDDGYYEEEIPVEEVYYEDEDLDEEVPEDDGLEEVVMEETEPVREEVQPVQPLYQEAEDDLDADFDFLEALLSDSGRSTRPDSADSIVDRATKKVGKEIPKAETPAPEKTVGAEKTIAKTQEKPVPDSLEDDDDFEFFDL